MIRKKDKVDFDKITAFRTELDLTPGEVVDFLEILQTSKQVRLKVGACPHEVEIITIWMYLKIDT